MWQWHVHRPEHPWAREAILPAYDNASRTMACSETALRLYGRERGAERGRFLLHVAHVALTDLWGLLCRPEGVILSSGLAQGIDGARALVGRGPQRLGRTKPPFEAPGERAKGTRRAAHRLRRHAEGLGGTVAMLEGATFQYFPPGDIIFRGESQPGAKVLRVRPLAPIRPKLGHHGLGNRVTHSVHRHEITPRNPQEMRTGGALRGMLTVGVGFATRRGARRGGLGRLICRLATGRDDRDDPFALRLTGAALARGEVEQGERWG